MSEFFYEYVGQSKKIKEKLLLDDATKWAESFVNPKNDKQLSSSQLRKFHFEVKQIEERCKGMSNDDFLEKMRPLVKMLKSKVAYACRVPGKERKVPEAFKKFMDSMIDNIETIDDFMAFALCFEAVVGYYYGLGGGKVR